MNRLQNDQYLTTADVARRLNKTPARVRHLADQGQLHPIRTASGLRLFREADVSDYVRGRPGPGLAT